MIKVPSHRVVHTRLYNAIDSLRERARVLAMSPQEYDREMVPELVNIAKMFELVSETYNVSYKAVEDIFSKYSLLLGGLHIPDSEEVSATLKKAASNLVSAVTEVLNTDYTSQGYSREFQESLYRDAEKSIEASGYLAFLSDCYTATYMSIAELFGRHGSAVEKIAEGEMSPEAAVSYAPKFLPADDRSPEEQFA